jgi:hypothetical protein
MRAEARCTHKNARRHSSEGKGRKNPANLAKMENLNEKVRTGLIVAVAGAVDFDNNSISSDKLWNWMKYVCQQFLYDSSKGLCTHKEQLLEISGTQIQPTDADKLK